MLSANIYILESYEVNFTILRPLISVIKTYHYFLRYNAFFRGIAPLFRVIIRFDLRYNAFFPVLRLYFAALRLYFAL